MGEEHRLYPVPASKELEIAWEQIGAGRGCEAAKAASGKGRGVQEQMLKPRVT